MKIFRNKNNLINEILGLKNLGFVPTMGALHKGHLSLVDRARKKSKKVLVSIYVNAKQFHSKKDLIKYPRNLEKDIYLLKKKKVDYLYLPNDKDIHSFKIKNFIYLDKFSRKLCGKFRPGHFKAVVDIINRFLEIIKPNSIYLGMKDFQQLSLIKLHIIKKKINTKLVACPTIRNDNGLALSSRNAMLTNNQILQAGMIYSYIKKNKKKILHKILNNKKLEVINKLIELGAKKVEYIECLNLKKLELCKNTKDNFNIFLAYYMRDIRLIDNL
jgi:pantoate--beta-alanine ligase